MFLRKVGRRLAIRASTALKLDTVARLRERRTIRLTHQPIVRVLFMHGTPAEDADGFRRHLAWLRRHFRIIDFAGFTHILDGTTDSDDDRPAVLLTFDDGVESNYEVAAPILDDAGIRALFFVVPEYSALSREQSTQFYRTRMRKPDGTPAMTPAQIRDLAARGHTIGNHTWSHAFLRDTPARDYDREILESAATIESWTGRRVHAFAWPFTWNAITPAAYRIAAARHRYCFAPCAGRIAAGQAGGVLWRTNIEAWYSPEEVRFQCSALADRAAAARRRHLTETLAPSGTHREAAA